MIIKLLDLLAAPLGTSMNTHLKVSMDVLMRGTFCCEVLAEPLVFLIPSPKAFMRCYSSQRKGKCQP